MDNIMNLRKIQCDKNIRENSLEQLKNLEVERRLKYSKLSEIHYKMLNIEINQSTLTNYRY